MVKCEICNEEVAERVFGPTPTSSLGLICRKCFAEYKERIMENIAEQKEQLGIIILLEEMFEIKLKFEPGIEEDKLFIKFPATASGEKVEWIKAILKENKKHIINCIKDEIFLKYSRQTDCKLCGGRNWIKVNGRWICGNCHRVEEISAPQGEK